MAWVSILAMGMEMHAYGVCVPCMDVCGMYMACMDAVLPGCRAAPHARSWLPEKDWSLRRELYVGCGVWKRLGYPLMGHRL
jgi:hypothetical protein